MLNATNAVALGFEPDLSTLEVRECPEDAGEALRTSLSGGTSERRG